MNLLVRAALSTNADDAARMIQDALRIPTGDLAGVWLDDWAMATEGRAIVAQARAKGF